MAYKAEENKIHTVCVVCQMCISLTWISEVNLCIPGTAKYFTAKRPAPSSSSNDFQIQASLQARP